jgi:hypothetical protein
VTHIFRLVVFGVSIDIAYVFIELCSGTRSVPPVDQTCCRRSTTVCGFSAVSSRGAERREIVYKAVHAGWYYSGWWISHRGPKRILFPVPWWGRCGGRRRWVLLRPCGARSWRPRWWLQGRGGEGYWVLFFANPTGAAVRLHCCSQVGRLRTPK